MNRIFSEWAMFAILDDEHNVIGTNDICEWGRFLEQFENRVVAKTRISGLEVSTVFLGLNHAYLPGQEPLWFETMVFADDDRAMPPEVAALLTKWRENQQVRYSTWREAEEGHAQMVQIIQEGLF